MASPVSEPFKPVSAVKLQQLLREAAKKAGADKRDPVYRASWARRRHLEFNKLLKQHGIRFEGL